jgi:hypothetical protein
MIYKMNYHQPWQQLNIDASNALRKDVNLAEMYQQSQYAGKPAALWHYRDREVDKLLDTAWIDRMHQAGVPVQSAMVFYREPYYMHPAAHIDVRWNGENCVAAFNWVLDDQDDSEMVWYNTPDIPTNMDLSPAGTKYLSWDLTDIEPYWLDAKIIGPVPTLVRTGIPHNVIVRSRARWAISVRYDEKSLDTWEKTVDFFKPWIINADS